MLISGLLLILAVKLTSSLPTYPSDNSTSILIFSSVQLSTCTDLDGCRSLSDLVYGCLGTIFACTSVSLHPNIPAPNATLRDRVLQMAHYFVMALLVPEWIFTFALRQFYEAGKLAKELEDAAEVHRKKVACATNPEEEVDSSDQHESDEATAIVQEGLVAGTQSLQLDVIPKHSSINTAKSVIDQEETPLIVTNTSCLEEHISNDAHHLHDYTHRLHGDMRRLASKRYTKEVTRRKWTRTHGLFVIMGGFQFFDKKSDTHLNPLCPHEVIYLVKNGLLLAPRLEDINDKSKADQVVKSIACVQTIWFVVQCVARINQHLPLTPLEATTVAYAVINIGIYSVWWYKPKSVGQPFRIYDTIPKQHHGDMDITEYATGLRFLDAVLGYVGQESDWYVRKDACRVSTFFSGVAPSWYSTFISGVDFISASIALVFAFLHLIPFSFEFPTSIEKIIWKTLVLVIIIVPSLLILFTPVGRILIAVDRSVENSRAGVWTWRNVHIGVLWVLSNIAWISIFVVLFILTPAYIIARIGLLGLAFSTLRDLPYTAYQDVTWAKYLPHVS